MSLLNRFRSYITEWSKEKVENDPSTPAADETQYKTADERAAESELPVEAYIGWSDRANELRQGYDDTSKAENPCPEEGCDGELEEIEHTMGDFAENYESRTGGVSKIVQYNETTGNSKGNNDEITRKFVQCEEPECLNFMPKNKAKAAHVGDIIIHERDHGALAEQDPYAGTTMDGVNDEQSLAESPTKQPDYDKVSEEAVDTEEDTNPSPRDETVLESVDDAEIDGSDTTSSKAESETDTTTSATGNSPRESIDKFKSDSPAEEDTSEAPDNQSPDSESSPEPDSSSLDREPGSSP